jgi:hypothetical protein
MMEAQDLSARQAVGADWIRMKNNCGKSEFISHGK